MKLLFISCILLLTGTISYGQLKIDSKDLANLVAIAEAYSAGKVTTESMSPLRTPRLDHIADTLVAASRGDGTILQTRFLKKPSDDELAMWYVIREIHYNMSNKTQKPRSNNDVAKEVLAKKIDRRWLLDNYYYRIRNGIALYFNDADLSKHDFRFEELGLVDKTEKAIFFLNTMEALAGGRFMVLLMTKNNKRILEFSDKFPTFDGRQYFLFRDFDYPDFEWIGYEKTESYNERHLDKFYATLIAHYRAETELRDKKVADDIFRRSILNEPKYFGLSGAPDALESLYKSKQ